MRAGMQELLSAYTGTLDLLDSHAVLRLEGLGKAHSGIQEGLSEANSLHTQILRSERAGTDIVVVVTEARTGAIDITSSQVDQ